MRLIFRKSKYFLPYFFYMYSKRAVRDLFVDTVVAFMFASCIICMYVSLFVCSCWLVVIKKVSVNGNKCNFLIRIIIMI